MMPKNTICYTGIGARKNFKHTVKQFRKVARKAFTRKECRRMRRKQKLFSDTKVCPPLRNTAGWVKLMGAESTTSEECDIINQ
jgi:hypothetical protein